MREYNITELKEIIREAYLEVLTEDAESSNRKKARRLLKDKKYVTRDNFKAGDEEELIVKHTLPDCVRYNHYKFAIFFYSLYYQCKDEVNKDDVWKIINTYFYNILKEEGDNFNYARYLTNKNDYTLIPLKVLLKIIEEYNSNKVEDDNKDYNASEYPYNGYKIVKNTSFVQSQEYLKYCDWCVVKSKQLYNRYTDNGENCFYYCLRYDFKDTNEPLSMLAVLVDKNGALKQVTTRENNGDHYYKTEQEVEEHFRINNFNSIFKPITEEEREHAQKEEQRIKEDYQKNIKQYLKQGHNIEDILRKAYDEFEYEYDLDLFEVYDNGEYNYIDKQGNLLFNEWYDNIWYINEINLFKIKSNNKFNYINKEGNLLFEEWFDFTDYNNVLKLFRVKNNNKYNYIDKEGNLFFKEWFDYIEYIISLDLFRVLNNNKYNYINKEGNLLSDLWVDIINYDVNADLFEIKIGNKYNYIDKQGNLLFKEWYDDIDYDEDIKLFHIKKSNKQNFIDKHDNLIFNEWYDIISYKEDLDLFLINKDNKWNFIDKEHNLLFKQWYVEIIYYYSSKLFFVIYNNKGYFIDINENIVKEIKK